MCPHSQGVVNRLPMQLPPIQHAAPLQANGPSRCTWTPIVPLVISSPDTTFIRLHPPPNLPIPIFQFQPAHHRAVKQTISERAKSRGRKHRCRPRHRVLRAGHGKKHTTCAMDFSHAAYFGGTQPYQFVGIPPLTPSHSNSAASDDFNTTSPPVVGCPSQLICVQNMEARQCQQKTASRRAPQLFKYSFVAPPSWSPNSAIAACSPSVPQPNAQSPLMTKRLTQSLLRRVSTNSPTVCPRTNSRASIIMHNTARATPFPVLRPPQTSMQASTANRSRPKA